MVNKTKSYIALLPCEVCGKIFKGRIYNNGYIDKVCSPACKALRRAEKVEKVTCFCGTEITAYKSQHRITCSRSCTSKLKWINYRITKQANSINHL